MIAAIMLLIAVIAYEVSFGFFSVKLLWIGIPFNPRTTTKKIQGEISVIVVKIK